MATLDDTDAFLTAFFSASAATLTSPPWHLANILRGYFTVDRFGNVRTIAAWRCIKRWRGDPDLSSSPGAEPAIGLINASINTFTD